MDKKKVDIENITQVTRLNMAYDKDEFLFVFNAVNDDCAEGQVFSIPIRQLATVVEGMKSIGLEYQNEYDEHIGFE